MITSSISAFTASVALQNSTKQPRITINTVYTLNRFPTELLATLKYVPLHIETTYIQLYSDGAFQNINQKICRLDTSWPFVTSSTSSNLITSICIGQPNERNPLMNIDMCPRMVLYESFIAWRKQFFTLWRKRYRLLSMWTTRTNRTILTEDDLWGEWKAACASG